MTQTSFIESTNSDSFINSMIVSNVEVLSSLPKPILCIKVPKGSFSGSSSPSKSPLVKKAVRFSPVLFDEVQPVQISARPISGSWKIRSRASSIATNSALQTFDKSPYFTAFTQSSNNFGNNSGNHHHSNVECAQG